MHSLKTKRISKIHNSSWRIVLALTGGGSKIIFDLLTVPGGSQTLLEAIVPYSTKALDHFLGRAPEQYCSGLTARQMAMVAFHHAQTIYGEFYHPDINTSVNNANNTDAFLKTISKDEAQNQTSLSNLSELSDPSKFTTSSNSSASSDFPVNAKFPTTTESLAPTDFPAATDFPALVGIGVTAALVSARPKKGAHRIFVALQSFDQTMELSLELTKNIRSREQEELVTAEFVLSAFEFFIEQSNRATRSNFIPSNNETFPTIKNSIINNNLKTDNHKDIQSDKADSDIRKEFNSDKAYSDIHEYNNINNNILNIKRTLAPSALKPLSLSNVPLPFLKPLLLDGEQVTGQTVLAGTHWSRLLFSSENESSASAVDGILYKNHEFTSFSCHEVQEKITPESRLIFSGSFRPIHHGHEGMIQAAENKFHLPVNLEISVRNVDKPPLDFYEIIQRIEGIENSPASTIPIWFTHYPKFIDKTCFFPGQFFIVGTDTLVRIADPKYDGSIEAHKRVIQEIANRGIHFVHFNRRENGIIWGLDHLNLEPDLREICLEIPPEIFVDDISSTLLRKQNRNID